MAKKSNVQVGTLADVVPLMREIYGEFSVKHGYPALNDEDFERLRKGTAREVFKWAGIKPWQLPGLLKEGRKMFSVRSGQILLFAGVAELVRELHAEGWHIYILSSNDSATIREILKRNQIESIATKLSRPPLFGKASSIKALLRANDYERHNVWMVGDEVRDIEAANKAGVNSIAVAWGLQHEIALAHADPTRIALKVPEIKKYLLKGE